MRLRRAIGSLLCVLGALASSGCDDERIPILEIDVVDRTAETARERAPAPYVLGPLLTDSDPGRTIYDPPPFLGKTRAAPR